MVSPSWTRTEPEATPPRVVAIASRNFDLSGLDCGNVGAQLVHGVRDLSD